MTELQPIVLSLAAFVSVIYSVLHGNIGALFNLLSPILQLRLVDFSKLKADLAALSPADRASLEAQFDASLSISDPTVLQKLVGAANVLDGAVSLAEDVITDAVQFYGRALALIAKFKSLFGLMLPAPLAGVKMGLGLPSWIVLPSWIPSWLVTIVLTVLVDAILPALAAALPAEAPLINALIAMLKGQGVSPRLKAAYDHFHAQASP